ncbi:MAG: tetratricopeptide repeat protein [Proteobacteria bacterium]|nr:tetratricopeptide repeat protein [Pseudomonadota bacterium]
MVFRIALSLVLLVFLALPVSAQESGLDEKEWARQMLLGNNFEKSRRIIDADEAFRLALALNPRGRQRAITLVRLARTSRLMKRLELAHAYSREALPIAVAEFGEKHDLTVAIRKQLSEIIEETALNKKTWQLGADDTLRHRLTDARFALDVAKFRRLTHAIIDRERTDVAVRYEHRLETGRIRATVFVTIATDTELRGFFERSDKAITLRNKAATNLLREEVSFSHQGRDRRGYRSAYNIPLGQNKRQVRAEMFVFKAGSALVKFRFDMLAPADNKLPGVVFNFIRDIGWPTKG